MNSELETLLVEDDLDTRANLTDILELDGHRIHVAGSFAEVRAAGQRSEIDLVILDRRLPDGEAEDVLPELKELLPSAEFIVVTGYADIEHAIAALKLGVVDYILKPIHPDVLRSSVARLARQKQTERELEREQRFANQVLTTAEAIILELGLDGRILRFNPYFTQISGWQLEEIQGHDWFETCIPDKDHDWVQEIFIRTAHDVHTSGVLNPIRTATEKERQIRWSNTTLKNEDNEATSILAIGVDVTDLIAAQQLASRSQRLAAIGQTVTGMAHESRNALHRIQTSAEILQLDIPPESDLRVEVDSIYRASVELNNTLDEVRQYAAPILLHRQPTMLPEVWRRVWGYLARTREGRDAEIVETECGCEFPVNVDIMRIEQVFRNIFENALSACTDPVRIHIDCRCDGPDSILMDIQDNGPGLSAEQRQRIFEPFFTTKSRGTGLGMSIVERIVEAHSGEIRIAEPKGHGARFLIRLLRDESTGSAPCPQEGVAVDARQ